MALPHRDSTSSSSQLFITEKSTEGDRRVTSKRWTLYLDHAIFAFLALFAITLPHSIKGAERSWKIALILWLLKLVVDRVRPYKQPLTLPLLFFVVLSAISTILS